MGDAQLELWDTGGDGPAVILLHPVTGTASVFAFQLHAFAAAGLRAIAYSRRGHGASDGASAEAGIATRDLVAVMDALGIERASLIALGGGGGTAIDFAGAYPERAVSLTLACSLCGMSEPGSKGGAGALIPAGFRELPVTFKELGPAFRWAYPDGVAAWEAASCFTRPPHPAPITPITPATLGDLDLPVLMVSGDADLYVPPPRLRALADAIGLCEVHVAPECGHSVHWERPDLFNAWVLDFLGRVLAKEL